MSTSQFERLTVVWICLHAIVGAQTAGMANRVHAVPSRPVEIEVALSTPPSQAAGNRTAKPREALWTAAAQWSWSDNSTASATPTPLSDAADAPTCRCERMRESTGSPRALAHMARAARRRASKHAERAARVAAAASRVGSSAAARTFRLGAAAARAVFYQALTRGRSILDNQRVQAALAHGQHYAAIAVYLTSKGARAARAGARELGAAGTSTIRYIAAKVRTTAAEAYHRARTGRQAKPHARRHRQGGDGKARTSRQHSEEAQRDRASRGRSRAAPTEHSDSSKGSAEDRQLLASQHTEAARILATPEGDHYAVLKLDPRCTTAQAKTAFRRLARLLHPDKCSIASAHEAFLRLQAAQGVLTDKARRLEYDRARLEAARGPTPSAFDFGVHSHHQHAARRSARSWQQEQADIEAALRYAQRYGRRSSAPPRSGYGYGSGPGWW